jgi:hypothetical protein
MMPSRAVLPPVSMALLSSRPAQIWSAKQGGNIVSRPIPGRVVRLAQPATSSMHAPYAVRRATPRLNACKLPLRLPHTPLLHKAWDNPQRVVTPLLAAEWEVVLRETGLWTDFHDVVSSIQNGFDTGVHQRLMSTYIPPNHSSVRKALGL